jgi:hypothetical protein
MLASTPYNRHGSARFDAQKGYAGTPTIRSARSLSFPFHSPGVWKRVSVASSVDRQSKGGVNFRRATRRCFSVWLSRSGKTWEDRPGRAIRHPLIPRHSTQVRDVMPRGSFRPSVSQLSGDLLDHELRSVERDRVTGALALQLSIDRGLGGDAHDLIAVAHKLACRNGNNKEPSA